MQQNNGPPQIRARIEPQYVRIIGDSVGVVNLTPAALQFLADKITEILTRTIDTAHAYTIHSRRLRLTHDDIDTGLTQRSIKPQLGHITKRTQPMRQLTMPSGEELFVRDDSDVDLGTIFENQGLKIPIQPYIKAHWLAVDGRLAVVPENVRPMKDEEEEDLPVVETEQEHDTRKPAALLARRETAGGSVGASVLFRACTKTVTTKEQIVIRPSLVEGMSVEQQLFLKEVVEACVGTDDKRRQEALQALETDTGLQPLLPRLSSMVYTAIRLNVVQRCLSMLIYVVRIVRAVSSNKSVKLEGVLHELIPALLSCMLGRQLCLRPESDNHWALRDFAAKTLIGLLRYHGVGDTTDRVIRMLSRSFEDPQSSYPMIYGTLMPLVEFSKPNQRTEISRSLHLMIERLTAVTMSGGPQTIDKLDANRLHAQLLKSDAMLKKMPMDQNGVTSRNM